MQQLKNAKVIMDDCLKIEGNDEKNTTLKLTYKYGVEIVRVRDGVPWSAMTFDDDVFLKDYVEISDQDFKKLADEQILQSIDDAEFLL